MVAHAKRSRRSPGMVDRLKEQAGEVTHLLKDGAKTIKDQAVETAGELTRVVKGEAGRLVDAQKARAAARIHSAGWAAQKSAQLLHAAKADRAAEYVDLAARAVEQASKYLEQNDLPQMLEDAAAVARRHPAATMGGLLLIGLPDGRFVKA